MRPGGGQLAGVLVTPRVGAGPVARERAAEAGVADRVEIRLIDYRDLSGERFDAIASIGMVEHVGAERIDTYAAPLAGLMPAGGRLMNHGIARLRHTDPEAGPFSERFVFPDAQPLQLSRVVAGAGARRLRDQHIEGFGDDYAETLRHWRDASTSTWPRRCGSSARSGCACGGYTCARPATGRDRVTSVPPVWITRTRT